MISLWLYRRLMAFYPSGLRNEYGSHMIEEFQEEWAEARRAGLIASVVFWLHLVRDWAETVAGSHAEIAGQDLRAASASLSRRPISTPSLVVLFACVICLNTVMLVVVQRLMLMTPPFEARGPLVYLAKTDSTGSPEWQTVPRPLVDRLARTTRNLEDVALIVDFTAILDGVPVRCYYAAPAAFRIFGLTAAAGRLFASDERGAVIGWRLWQQRYRGLPAVIASSLNIAGREYRIVGALDNRDSPFDADVWLPLPSPGISGALVARLKRGAVLRNAQAEWAEIQRRGVGLPLAELNWLRRANRDSKFDFIIWLCQAAFLAALLLACADLASLQFGHSLRRQREIALRMAVGGSHGRLLQFLLTESIVTALLGGALSLPLSAALMAFLHARLDPIGVYKLWGWSFVGLDRFAVVVALVLSLASGVFAGFFPAWRIVNRDPWPMLALPRQDSRSSVSRLRLVLLSAQVGLAAALVCFAIAFAAEGRGRMDAPAVQYFRQAWQVSLALPNPRNPLNLFPRLSQRLAEKGLAVVVTDTLPFVNGPDPFEYEAGGRHVAYIAHVNARFFDTPGFRWLRGRVWTEAEESRFPPPVVVNQAIVQEASPLANSLVIVNPNGTRVQTWIAGVVEQPSLDPYRAKAPPTIFIPYPAGRLNRTMMLVRFSGSAEAARSTIETVVREVDPVVQPYFQYYGDRIRITAIGWRYLMALLSVTALLALGLALTGSAAYLTQTFSERSQEVALRCALGSRCGGIWIWATRQVCPALIAVVAAASASAEFAKWLPSRMVPTSRLVLWAACGFSVILVLGMWSAACWLASRRAAANPLMDRLRRI